MTIHEHIIGSAFSEVLSSPDTPVSEGGEPLANPGTWGVALQAVQDGEESMTIPGSWISSVAPTYRMLFSQNNTSTWIKGLWNLRIVYTAPDSRVFIVPTDLQLELKA
jgi:hypothetical protein